MKISVNTEIALTYLSSRKKQTAVAAMGVMFGISMFIFMQSLMKGTNDYFEKSSFSTTAHIRLYSENKVADAHMLNNFLKDNSTKILTNPKQLKQSQGLTNPYGIIQNIRENPQVVAVTPQVTANVIYASGSVNINGTVAGVSIDEEDKMFDVQSNMKEGDLHDLNRVNNGLLIGKGIADKLSLRVGDNITVRAGSGSPMIMRVVGIFATTIKQIDETKSYANIVQAQNLLGKDRSYVTDIKINLADYNNAPMVAKDIETITGYKAEDWVQSNEQLKAAFKIRAIILNSVIGVILLVAGFGIYNILNMTIYEKIKEIAILKATGFSGKSVISIFLQQAVYIGLMGGIIGVIFGFLITFMVSKIYIGAGTLKYLPMSFYIPHYIEAVSFGILTTIAAGFFPARKASKVDPVTIIRG
ncbi:ABC transporter permease [Flavipsychrobacter stenotrophus]|uniref:ABC transporter permease n=1 Tax=Flavipsychrobacter stenotrophus TaxID=2077091 RepID=A0A2S7ST46_9BACT|nr:ABC transporter permease [Flavipsychrobacter stenotrophus]PQJ09914.1 ABC transporter permease [Flavipsychrobacter stenotrophus]